MSRHSLAAVSGHFIPICGDTPGYGTSRLPDAAARLEAGVAVFSYRGLEGKLTYNASLAPGYTAQSLVGRLAYMF